MLKTHEKTKLTDIVVVLTGPVSCFKQFIIILTLVLTMAP